MSKQDRDEITLWIANDEGFYNQVMRLYDRWVDDGDAWDERRAEEQMAAVVAEIAEALASEHSEAGPYTLQEKRDALAELMSDFEAYREAEIAERQKQAAAETAPRPPMDEEAIAYVKRMDRLLIDKVGVRMLPDVADHPVNMTEEDAKQAAVEYLGRFMPVSAAKIRSALEKGDQHLNTIKLRKWDEKAEAFNYRRFRLTLSEAVGLLKHVATWYYA